MMSVGGDVRAAGLTLTESNGRYSSTHAQRKGLRTWDNSKRYGAERIRDRDRSAFQPDGLRMGNFLLFPSFDVDGSYRSRGASDSDFTSDDWRLELQPQLAIRSDLPRHVFDLLLDGQVRLSDDPNLETEYLGAVDVFTRVDINNAHAFNGGLRAARAVQEVLDAERPTDSSESIKSDEYSGHIALKRDAGRLSAEIRADWQYIDYYDVAALDGSNIDQDFRDTTKIGGQLDLNYRFSPGYSISASSRVETIDNRGTDERTRDAINYSVGLGLQAELNPLVRFAVRGSYAWRDYRTDAFDDFGSVLFQADVQWLATQTLTLYGTVAREYAETGYEDASARQDTRVGASFEYEIWRNLVATGGVTYTEQEFVGTLRTDEVLDTGISLEYLAHKNRKLTLSYNFEERSSSIDLFAGEVHEVRAGITFQY